VKTKDQFFPRWCNSINHYVGKVGKLNDFSVAYFLTILCAKYCRNLSTYVDTGVKRNRGFYFWLALYIYIQRCFVSSSLHSLVCWMGGDWTSSLLWGTQLLYCSI